MTVPDVTVSIVNHSNRDAVLACLDSLASADAYRRDVEIVVLDNASDDGSVEAIEERHPAVRVIAQHHRAGFGANHNTIVRATDSRYVLILNDDTVVEPGVVDALADFLDAHPDVAAAGPDIVRPDGGRQETAWRARTPLRALVFALTLAQAGFVQAKGRGPREAEVVSCTALLVRRDELEAIGLFDEGFFMYCEDEDLCRRLRTRGKQIFWLPEISVVHESTLSSADAPDHKVNEVWRSLRRLSTKHHGRVGGGFVVLAIGTARGVIGSLMWVAGRLPARLRPKRAVHWQARAQLLAAANAWRGVRGAGLRELAEDWNAAHARSPVGASRD